MAPGELAVKSVEMPSFFILTYKKLATKSCSGGISHVIFFLSILSLSLPKKDFFFFYMFYIAQVTANFKPLMVS